MAGATVQCIGYAEFEYPALSPLAPFAWEIGEAPIARDYTQRFERREGAAQAGNAFEAIAQRRRTPNQRAIDNVEPEKLQSVTQQQMLGPVGVERDRDKGRQREKVDAILSAGEQIDDAGTDYRWIDRGRP